MKLYYKKFCRKYIVNNYNVYKVDEFENRFAVQ